MRSSFKQLRFPVSGVAKHLSYGDSTIPDENRAFAAPYAVNVRNTCTFGERVRGGSRPGLRRIEGTVTVVDGGKWLWPNGEAIAWPDGNVIAYTSITKEIVAPDGSQIIDQHEPISAVAAKGAIPSAPSAAAVYCNRVFLASGADWFCSRIGEHGDFDYGGIAEDTAKALAGNCALAGRKGENITAFMPMGDSAMYVATARSLWMFRGDPSGGLVRISEYTGCISSNAWCVTPQGIVFLAQDGLYGAFDDGVKILSAKIPEDFSGIDEAILAYDPQAKGVHIFAERFGESCDWFMAMDGYAFWPVKVPQAMRPVAMCRIIEGGVDKLALHGADGEWRVFHEEQESDDGEVFVSEVVVGPFRVSARDGLDGMIDALEATFAKGSAAISVEVFSADSAEEAVEKTQEVNPVRNPPAKMMSEGRNKVWRPRTRGAWACLKISSLGRWAYEGISVETKLLGRFR